MEICIVLFGLVAAGSLGAGIGLAVRERRRSFERAMADACIEPIRPAAFDGPLPPRPPVPALRTVPFAPPTLAARVRDACSRKLNEAKEAVAEMSAAGIEALPDPWLLEAEAPVPMADLETWKAFEQRVDTLARSIDTRRPVRRRDIVSGRASAKHLYPTPRPAAGAPAPPRVRAAATASRPYCSEESSADDDFSSSVFAASDGGGADDGGGCSDGGGSDAGSCSSSD